MIGDHDVSVVRAGGGFVAGTGDWSFVVWYGIAGRRDGWEAPSFGEQEHKIRKVYYAHACISVSG